jgi:hypothetical protein
MELEKKHFYAVKQSPMAFTGPEFKKALPTLNSDLYALSVGRRLDVDDLYAVYPNGEFILSLTKDTLLSTGFATSNKHTAHQSSTFGPAMLQVTPSSMFL